MLHAQCRRAPHRTFDDVVAEAVEVAVETFGLAAAGKPGGERGDVDLDGVALQPERALEPRARRLDLCLKEAVRERGLGHHRRRAEPPVWARARRREKRDRR